MNDCPQSLQDKLASRGYECIRLLGEGNYAKVYLVQYNNEELALKVINLDKAPDKKTSYDQFQNELKVIEALHESKNSFCHYVIQYPEEFWRDDNMIFIPMRLAVSNLNDFLTENDEKLTIDVLKNIFCQITKGLECLYKLGFVYTDLKPENVLVMSNGEMRVADLGSSYPMEKSDYEFVASNYNYMSPEVAYVNFLKTKNEPFKFTEKSIVFSLGIMLMYLFKEFAELFIYAESRYQYIKKLVETDFAEIHAKKVPYYRVRLSNQDKDQLNELLGKMLQTEPANRPTLKQVMCDPFFTSINCCPPGNTTFGKQSMTKPKPKPKPKKKKSIKRRK